MKNNAKTMKNNEKVWLEDFDPGWRTSTLARGLRPVVSGKTGPRTSTHPPGVLQRGNTTGNTKREHNGKKMEKRKMKKKIISINFNFIQVL